MVWERRERARSVATWVQRNAAVAQKVSRSVSRKQQAGAAGAKHSHELIAGSRMRLDTTLDAPAEAMRARR